MTHSLKKFGLSAFLIASLALSASGTADIRLQNFDLTDVSLKDMVVDDRYTLVMVWSTDCPACEEQKPMIQSFHDDYKNSSAKVVGVALRGLDDLAEINALIDKNKPSYPNYLASASTFLDDFKYETGTNFAGTPSYIMFAPSGEAIGVAVGPVTREQLESVIAE